MRVDGAEEEGGGGSFLLCTSEIQAVSLLAFNNHETLTVSQLTAITGLCKSSILHAQYRVYTAVCVFPHRYVQLSFHSCS